MAAWVYMLECVDGSYYAGSHRGQELQNRLIRHHAGEGSDYTRRRLPVTLVYAQEFQWNTDAIAAERKLKGWSRAKKQALIAGNWTRIRALSKRRGGRPSRLASRAPQDEDDWRH